MKKQGKLPKQPQMIKCELAVWEIDRGGGKIITTARLCQKRHPRWLRKLMEQNKRHSREQDKRKGPK